MAGDSATPFRCMLGEAQLLLWRVCMRRTHLEIELPASHGPGGHARRRVVEHAMRIQHPDRTTATTHGHRNPLASTDDVERLASPDKPCSGAQGLSESGARAPHCVHTRGLRSQATDTAPSDTWRHSVARHDTNSCLLSSVGSRCCSLEAFASPKAGRSPQCLLHERSISHIVVREAAWAAMEEDVLGNADAAVHQLRELSDVSPCST